MSVRLFLSHSFDMSRPDSGGPSDVEVADWFKKKIEEFGSGNMSVVTARDPVEGRISEQIGREIETCDGVFALFTRSHRIGEVWLPSQYVLSESAYAMARFHAQSPKKSVYAFIEEGIDRNGLGIAFSSDDQLPMFSRTDLTSCEDDLKVFIESLIEAVVNEDEFPIVNEKLHQKAVVRRDTFVFVTSRHGIQVLDPQFLEIGHLRHHIWRVREPLPTVEQLVSSNPSAWTNEPFLNCRLISCNDSAPDGASMRMDDFRTTRDGRETGFDIRFDGLDIRRGTLLEYEITWGYQDAFLSVDETGFEYNSASLSTGQGGVVGEVTLEISFERNWKDGDEIPIFSIAPAVSRSKATHCPPDIDLAEFWSDSSYWSKPHQMRLTDDETTSTLSAAYRAVFSNFQGQIKATWQPHATYHLRAPPKPTPKRRRAKKSGSKTDTGTVRIFISYAREDKQKAEDLYQRLAEEGFEPWIDTKNILGGERWESSIERAIKTSDFFIGCLSTNSVSKRGFLQKEIKTALDVWKQKLDSDIFLIPVRLEECDVPESLRTLHWLDLFASDGWDKLRRAIQIGIQRRGE